MLEWHQQLNGCESEQTPGDSEGQGWLVCCSPWGHKELDTTQQLNNNRFNISLKGLQNSGKCYSFTITKRHRQNQPNSEGILKILEEFQTGNSGLQGQVILPSSMCDYTQGTANPGCHPELQCQGLIGNNYN